MIILFDLDSTLVTIEGCDRLAEKKGILDQISPITQATMNGTMAFDSAFPEKTCLLAPSTSDLHALAEAYTHHITSGMESLISDLQKQGDTNFCVL